LYCSLVRLENYEMRIFYCVRVEAGQGGPRGKIASAHNYMYNTLLSIGWFPRRLVVLSKRVIGGDDG
jgi:hypothetical protein